MCKERIILVALIFEDNIKSTLGDLLSKSYNSSNIYFSNGNSRLLKKIKSIYNNYNTIIVFFDFVPNNESLFELLGNLYDRLCLFDTLHKVHIIPIVCSEYIYISNLVLNFGVLESLDLRDTIGYTKSCEKYYKAIFKTYENSVGSFSENEADYFYFTLPVFDVKDSSHELILNNLGLNSRFVNFDIVRDKVFKFYCNFFKLFGIDFLRLMDSLSVNLC